jgi:inner membrane protein
MMGKTHKAIGLATGVAVTLYGVKNFDEPLFALASLTALLGALLPDIDHNNTNLGRARKKVVSFTSVIIKIASVVSLFVIGLICVLNEDYKSLSILLLSVLLVTLMILFMSNSKIGAKLQKFSTKHRGIMHTLLVPALLVIPLFFVKEYYIIAPIIGFIAGYVSHLLADMCTVSGVPILFPLTMRNISLLPIRTGTVWEYIIAFIISAGALAGAWFII